jgi:TRAP-type C4-dicarboxylate transport system permease small subunit
MIADVFLAVLTRYVLKEPFNFCDAIAKYLLIWFCLLAAGLAVQDKAHIAVHSLIKNWPVRAKKVLFLVINIFSSAFLLLIGIYGIGFAAAGINFTERMAWDMPLIYAYTALPVGFFYIAFELNIETILVLLDDREDID